MNWSKVGCWLDIEDISWNGVHSPDDDFVFDFSSGMENAEKDINAYLILNVDTLVTTRNVTVSGLTSGNCQDTYGAYSGHWGTTSRNLPIFTLQISHNGILNVTSFITNNLCLDHFALKIYETGLLNLREDSLIDSVVFNWGKLSAERPGIQLGVFVLLLGCGNHQSLPEISNLDVFSASRKNFVSQCKFEASRSELCLPTTNKEYCLSSFTDSDSVDFCGTDIFSDLITLIENSERSVSQILMGSRLVSSVILLCRNGINMTSSNIRVDEESAIIISPSAGNVIGNQCSLHSSGMFIVASSCPNSVNTLQLMCTIKSFGQLQVFRRTSFHAPVQISGIANVSSSHVSRVDRTSTDCNVITFFHSVSILNSSIIDVEDSFESENNLCSIIILNQSNSNSFKVDNLTLSVQVCKNQLFSHSALLLSNCAAFSNIGTIALEFSSPKDSFCMNRNNFNAAARVIWACSTTLTHGGVFILQNCSEIKFSGADELAISDSTNSFEILSASGSSVIAIDGMSVNLHFKTISVREHTNFKLNASKAVLICQNFTIHGVAIFTNAETIFPNILLREIFMEGNAMLSIDTQVGANRLRVANGSSCLLHGSKTLYISHHFCIENGSTMFIDLISIEFWGAKLVLEYDSVLNTLKTNMTFQQSSFVLNGVFLSKASTFIFNRNSELVICHSALSTFSDSFTLDGTLFIENSTVYMNDSLRILGNSSVQVINSY